MTGVRMTAAEYEELGQLYQHDVDVLMRAQVAFDEFDAYIERVGQLIALVSECHDRADLAREAEQAQHKFEQTLRARVGRGIVGWAEGLERALADA